MDEDDIYEGEYIEKSDEFDKGYDEGYQAAKDEWVSIARSQIISFAKRHYGKALVLLVLGIALECSIYISVYKLVEKYL